MLCKISVVSLRCENSRRRRSREGATRLGSFSRQEENEITSPSTCSMSAFSRIGCVSGRNKMSDEIRVQRWERKWKNQDSVQTKLKDPIRSHCEHAPSFIRHDYRGCGSEERIDDDELEERRLATRVRSCSCSCSCSSFTTRSRIQWIELKMRNHLHETGKRNQDANRDKNSAVVVKGCYVTWSNKNITQAKWNFFTLGLFLCILTICLLKPTQVKNHWPNIVDGRRWLSTFSFQTRPQ